MNRAKLVLSELIFALAVIDADAADLQKAIEAYVKASNSTESLRTGP